ncbi:DUF4062 domain-containing protein [Listeria booriae]|uniref:DUF4062 domain-containing protein n=1 Tax=Listeria booriae TaxID=1552123 RepID=A0A7X1CDI0_9LIST|nr:DUF4062 domain-containing protein [Listeria booriae]MBC1493520.1 DUF4062 domain-containing protein [Listeria booriae]
MERKLQVFISSTYTDLIEERQKVVEAVLNAGHIPAGMELFKAGATQESTIKRWIEESDIYLLMVGARYGSLHESGISYTEWEYNLAEELNKPMFSLVFKDEYIEERVHSRIITSKDNERSNPIFKAFIQKLSSKLYSPVSHIAEIRGHVTDGITNIERTAPDGLTGWVKGHYLKLYNEEKLKNDELMQRVVASQEEIIETNKNKKFNDDFIGSFSYEFLLEELEKEIISADKFDHTDAQDRLYAAIGELHELNSLIPPRTPRQEEMIYNIKIDIQIYEAMSDGIPLILAWKRFEQQLMHGTFPYVHFDKDVTLSKSLFSFLSNYKLIDRVVRVKKEGGETIKYGYSENGVKFRAMLKEKSSYFA